MQKATAKEKLYLLSETSKELFIYICVIVIVLLSALNISSYLTPNKVRVLGAESENTSESFWQDFLIKNPNYVPGWIETGRTDKALKIDPNFKLDSSY